MRRMLFTLTALFLNVSLLSAQPAETDRTKLLEFFETKVRPVLAENCFTCHGPNKQKGGIRLDRKEFVFKVEDEPLIVPGYPDKSLLLRAIRHQGDHKMPPAPREKLPAAVLDDFALWIKLGAPWPDDKAKTAGKGPDQGKHWAFQPVRKPGLPPVKNTGWSDHPVDAFILAKLEAKGLTPNPLADPRTVVRRLSFDLLGLPPSPEEVEAFVKVCSSSSPSTHPSPLEKLVDRYLASPHYGERWARHWLDVARYADTKGYVFQEERRYPYAYAYRDYVVKAFNDDLPYDQFILHQLAADRLVAKGQAPVETQAAMGYLTLGRRFLNNIHDITDDRIDVVTRGMLGLTVACARCHDHKYDPISTKEYYGLYGVFVSSVEPKELPLLGEPAQTPEYVAFQKKLTELERAVTDYQTQFKTELASKNRKHRDALVGLKKKVDAFRASSPVAPPRGMVLVEGPSPHDARVLLRGNPNSPGPIAPRQFLTALSPGKLQPFKEGSGRLELARAIADKNNPLTARVFVNRVWLEHFGAGLVASPSNFGLRAEPPSHPELLDYLAATFVENGWSIKKLHRLIVTSKTYQMSSAENVRAHEVDADNRWLARANRRRLDFEALRDSLLAASAQLDLTMGGKSIDITTAPYSKRRTLYGYIDRQNLPGVFRTFDFASPDSSTPVRYQTTVPQQALFMLNHPFVQEQARALLRRSEVQGVKDDVEKMRRLHRLVYARQADEEDLRAGRQYLESAASVKGPESTQAMTPWERYAQVLLIANEFVFVD